MVNKFRVPMKNERRKKLSNIAADEFSGNPIKMFIPLNKLKGNKFKSFQVVCLFVAIALSAAPS